MNRLTIACKLLLGISLVFLLAEGCKDRQEPVTPEEPSVVRKRVDAPLPSSVQIVKPGDIEPAAPVSEKVTTKSEPPEATSPKLAEVKAPVEEKTPAPKPGEVKPPAEKKAPAPEPAAEPKQAVEETDKGVETSAVAERRPVSALEKPSAGIFTINVASFKTQPSADRYVEELKKVGIDAYVWEVNLPEKGKWHRVAVGHFPTLQEAKDHKEELIQKGISGSFITKVTEPS
jgi:cell division septation protein DedD